MWPFKKKTKPASTKLFIAAGKIENNGVITSSGKNPSVEIHTGSYTGTGEVSSRDSTKNTLLHKLLVNSAIVIFVALILSVMGYSWQRKFNLPILGEFVMPSGVGQVQPSVSKFPFVPNSATSILSLTSPSDTKLLNWENEIKYFATRYMAYFGIIDQIETISTSQGRLRNDTNVGLRSGSLLHFSYKEAAVEELLKSHDLPFAESYISSGDFYWGGQRKCFEQDNECIPAPGPNCFNKLLAGQVDPSDPVQALGCKCVSDTTNTFNGKSYAVNVCRIDLNTTFESRFLKFIIRVTVPKLIPGVRIYNGLPWTKGSGCYFDKTVDLPAGESIIETGCPYAGTKHCYNFSLDGKVFWNEMRECPHPID
jgi:hypothetical protein